MWKTFIRDYLTFTKGQRKGLFIFMGIILLCKIAPLFFPYFDKGNKKQDSFAFKQSVAAFMALQQKEKHRQPRTVQAQTHLFPFDPNKLTIEKWQELGLSKKTATIIQHYRNAGGHFYKKEDLKKIYGLADSTYRKLAPYIRIEQSEKQLFSSKKTAHEKGFTPNSTYLPEKKPHERKRFVLDINTADSASWSRLYGIGPVLSARIVRYRNALGGFFSIAQIAEVYGLPDSTFQRIKKQLNISPVSLKKLNINTASVEMMKSHPYINSRLASAIKAFRDMHGTFDSLPELKALQLVNDQIYRKLVPYLSVK